MPSNLVHIYEENGAVRINEDPNNVRFSILPKGSFMLKRNANELHIYSMNGGAMLFNFNFEEVQNWHDNGQNAEQTIQSIASFSMNR